MLTGTACLEMIFGPLAAAGLALSFQQATRCWQQSPDLALTAALVSSGSATPFSGHLSGSVQIC